MTALWRAKNRQVKGNREDFNLRDYEGLPRIGPRSKTRTWGLHIGRKNEALKRYKERAVCVFSSFMPIRNGKASMVR